MKRWLLTLVIVALAAAASSTMTPHGAAQDGGAGSADERNLVCRTSQFDLTNDGLLTKSDLNAWFSRAEADGCRETSLDDKADCKYYDYNDDRFVDDTDVAVAHARFMSCVFGSVDERGR